MTGREMQRKVQQQISTVDVPIPSQDTEHYINRAQTEFVQDRFERENQRDGKFFESNVRIAEELKVLVTPDTELDAYYGGENAAVDGFEVDQVDFEEDHLYLLNHRSIIKMLGSDAEVETSGDPATREVTNGTSVTRVVSNRTAQQDDIYRMLDDPFNKSRPDSPIVTYVNNGLQVYTDKNFIVDKVKVTYLRTPKKIVFSSQDCELPESTHNEIVSLAADMIIEDARKEQLHRPKPSTSEE